MMDWQWHQLDHMQIICTLLQTDNHNHASTSPLSFYKPDIFVHICTATSSSLAPLKSTMVYLSGASLLE